MEALTGGSVLAILGATLGTLGTKLIDKWKSKQKTDADVSKDLRSDLYKEINELRSEKAKAEVECDKWRDRYYEQLQQLAPLRGELADCQRKVKRMEESEIRRVSKTS